MCVGPARVGGDGPLQRRDGLRQASSLQAGEAEIVLDDRIGRRKQCRVVQRLDRVGWPPRLEQLGGQRKQGRDMRRGWEQLSVDHKGRKQSHDLLKKCFTVSALYFSVQMRSDSEHCSP